MDSRLNRSSPSFDTHSRENEDWSRDCWRAGASETCSPAALLSSGLKDYIRSSGSSQPEEDDSHLSSTSLVYTLIEPSKDLIHYSWEPEHVHESDWENARRVGGSVLPSLQPRLIPSSIGLNIDLGWLRKRDSSKRGNFRTPTIPMQDLSRSQMNLTRSQMNLTRSQMNLTRSQMYLHPREHASSGAVSRATLLWTGKNPGGLTGHVIDMVKSMPSLPVIRERAASLVSERPSMEEGRRSSEGRQTVLTAPPEDLIELPNLKNILKRSPNMGRLTFLTSTPAQLERIRTSIGEINPRSIYEEYLRQQKESVENIPPYEEFARHVSTTSSQKSVNE